MTDNEWVEVLDGLIKDSEIMVDVPRCRDRDGKYRKIPVVEGEVLEDE